MAATTTLLATTNSTHGPSYGVSSRVKPYLVEHTIDFSNQNIDANGSTIEVIDTVSYTHLTLPTILRV